MLTTTIPRRSTSRVDLYDFKALLFRETTTTHTLTENVLPVQSPPPMTYRDLRLVMSKKLSSNIVVLPKTFPLAAPPPTLAASTSSKSTSPTFLEAHRKVSHLKKSKRTRIDVYRSLYRAESPGVTLFKREISNDEIFLLANSFAIDHRSTLPTSGFFHPQNLPNIQKHRLTYQEPHHRRGSSKTLSSYTSSPSLHIQHVGHSRPKSTRIAQFSTPVQVQLEEQHDETASTTTVIETNMPEKQTRKQLHVYMPQIFSC